MWNNPNNLLCGVTVNQEDGRIYVSNGGRVYTIYQQNRQWNESNEVVASKRMVSRYFNENRLVRYRIHHAVPFGKPGALVIASCMGMSLYGLAFYAIAPNQCADEELPLGESLHVKEGVRSWVNHTPPLDLTLNKITTDHPTLNDTFLLEILSMRLRDHLDDADPPKELTDCFEAMDDNFSMLTWRGRGMENSFAETPVLRLLQRVCATMQEAVADWSFNYNGHDCGVEFEAMSQKKFFLKANGLTIELIADIAVCARFFRRIDNETVSRNILMTLETKSPGCAISEGAKSCLDSDQQLHEREQRNLDLYNQLKRVLERFPQKYRIKKSYANSMKNAEINFVITLRQAAPQAVFAKTNLFAIVDGVSLTIFEIKHLGPLNNDIVKLACNVYHTDIDQKNLGVIFFRSLWNKFCYTYGGDSLRNEFTSFRGDGRRFSGTEYSHSNRSNFQRDIQQLQGDLYNCYRDYASRLLAENVDQALDVHGAVELSWDDFKLGEPIQDVEGIGFVGERGVRAKVYKSRRVISGTTCVLKSRRVISGTTCVLKLLEPTSDGLQLYENEVNAYVRLRESEAASFIPEIYNYGVLYNRGDEKYPTFMLFIELELIKGEEVPGNRQDDINNAERMFSHCGVEHNDLIPQNMLYDTANHQLKIFDFGQASVH